MKKGDLVRIKLKDTDPQDRRAGVVIAMDVHHPDSSSAIMPIANVMWNSGLGWIDASRIEVVSVKV
jgi:hypothetical protein